MRASRHQEFQPCVFQRTRRSKRAWQRRRGGRGRPRNGARPALLRPSARRVRQARAVRKRLRSDAPRRLAGQRPGRVSRSPFCSCSRCWPAGQKPAGQQSARKHSARRRLAGRAAGGQLQVGRARRLKRPPRHERVSGRGRAARRTRSSFPPTPAGSTRGWTCGRVSRCWWRPKGERWSAGSTDRCLPSGLRWARRARTWSTTTWPLRRFRCRPETRGPLPASL